MLDILQFEFACTEVGHNLSPSATVNSQHYCQAVTSENYARTVAQMLKLCMFALERTRTARPAGNQRLICMQVLLHVCLRTILTTGTDYLHQAAVAARVVRSNSLGVHLNLASELLGPVFSLACNFIPNPQTITSADVSWNSMDPIGARNFAHCLKHMSSLRRLDVSNNAMLPEVAELLSHGVVYATTLTELNLSGNKLGAEGFQHLSTALFALTRLEVLDLSDNDLCVSLAHMDAVRDYEASTASAQPPPLSDIGVSALNTVLEQSSSLRELVLSGNMLGASGMRVRYHHTGRLSQLVQIQCCS